MVEDAFRRATRDRLAEAGSGLREGCIAVRHRQLPHPDDHDDSRGRHDHRVAAIDSPTIPASPGAVNPSGRRGAGGKTRATLETAFALRKTPPESRCHCGDLGSGLRRRALLDDDDDSIRSMTHLTRRESLERSRVRCLAQQAIGFGSGSAQPGIAGHRRHAENEGRNVANFDRIARRLTERDRLNPPARGECRERAGAPQPATARPRCGRIHAPLDTSAATVLRASRGKGISRRQWTAANLSALLRLHGRAIVRTLPERNPADDELWHPV